MKFPSTLAALALSFALLAPAVAAAEAGTIRLGTILPGGRPQHLMLQ